MTSKSCDNFRNSARGASELHSETAKLSAQIDECEQRIASLIWTLGVIRRGVEWQDDSPILRIIDRAMCAEDARGEPLGPNVARMTFRRATPAPAYYQDLDSA